MKKFLSFAALLLAFVASSWAYDFSVVAPSGQTLYYTINSGTNTVTVTSQNGNWPYYSTYPTGALTIPSTVTHNSQTYSVTSIGPYAFYRCSGLTSVTIPNSVTSIGYDAFYYCSGLTRVNYTGTIANWCGITFDNESANPLFYVNHLYINNSEVTSVTIPNSVTSIGDYAFLHCSSLTSVTIPNSVTSIGKYAFRSCSGLTSVTIPNSVTSIGHDAFAYCSGLTRVNYTGTIANWCGIRFGGQYANPLYNAHHLYINNSEVTSVTIPNSVTSIGDHAFSGCSGLTSVTIPNSVTSIGEGAFSGCSGLTSVTIPNSVTSIGRDAFGGCSGLTSVTIPNSVTSIDVYTFSGCSGLTSVTIPNSVTSISDGAFAYCSGLTGSLTIPNSVTSIGNWAFYGCSGLTSVTIGNSVTTIGNWAFRGCSGLTSVTFNAINCTTMRSSYNPVFDSCTNCSSLTIGDSVRNIPDYAFKGCSGLTSITSNASVPPALGTDAFLYVSSTIPVNIPCGSSNSYDSCWSYFSNFVEIVGDSFSATTSDSTRGIVQVLTEPTCTNPTAVIYAAANTGYHFDHWSDNNTENPRTIALTSDTAVVGYFASDNGEEGIDAASASNVIVRTMGDRITIEGIQDETIRLFDCMGRCLQTVKATEGCTLQAPAAGVYLLQVGDDRAQKVVVTK